MSLVRYFSGERRAGWLIAVEETCSRNARLIMRQRRIGSATGTPCAAQLHQAIRALTGPGVGEHRDLRHQSTPYPDSQAGRSIACDILLESIVRLAVARHSPPDLLLLFSAAKLGGKLDLCGLSTMLATPSSNQRRRSLTVINADPRVETTLLLIRANYRQPSLTLRSVAEEVHLSPWYLSRVLVHYTGLSFKGHLDETRLRNAAILLERTFLSIRGRYS